MVTTACTAASQAEETRISNARLIGVLGVLLESSENQRLP